MNEFIFGVISVFWFGILTSISPCPLATNLVAISYLSKNFFHFKQVLLSSFIYVLGRMVAYTVLGFIIIKALLGLPVIAQFFQNYFNKLLGPLLIIVGLVLLGIVRIDTTGLVLSLENQNKLAQRRDLIGSFILGLLFALSFCPISAGLFFGSLIPLAFQNKSGWVFPFIYGLGTGLPVLFFSITLALGIRSITRWFQRIGRFEHYSRKVTGIIFIGVGLFYSWNYILANILQNF